MWHWLQRWPRWIWAVAGLLIAGLVVVAALVWRGDGGEAAAPATSTTATGRPGTTAASLPVVTTVTTVAPGPITTTGPPQASGPGVPGVVVALARSGGNSGEVQVDWNAFPAATGYRVLRTDADGGRARIVADVDITTGGARGALEVVGLWSAEHNYVPDGGPLSSPDGSSWFRYVDVGEGQRCYRVQANTSAGEGPLSEVTCGSPPETVPLPSGSAPRTSY